MLILLIQACIPHPEPLELSDVSEPESGSVTSHEEEDDLGTVSELSVEEEVPHESNGLEKWLKKGHEGLTRLFNRTRQRPSKRGPYYHKGFQPPSLRTQQHHAKVKKDQQAAVSNEYGTSNPLLQFFKPKPAMPLASPRSNHNHIVVYDPGWGRIEGVRAL
jgi:hypothetical protein